MNCNKASFHRWSRPPFSALSGAALLLFMCIPAAPAFADTVTGTVRNQTTGQPASGDDVLLLRPAEGMREEARTKTDPQGAFSLNVADPGAPHLVRVLHQGVNYDHAVTGAVSLQINVFDALPRIRDLSGNIGIVQIGSEGKVLKVTEMYSIINASNPPVTQAGARNFEITLPGKAALDSVQVRNSGGNWVNARTMPLAGNPDHYNIDFPVRPGETLYRFEYHLPYRSRVAFHLKSAYPVKKFAVTHPPSIVFRAARPGTFESPGISNGLKIEAAIQPVTSDVPPFEISGGGAIPPLEPPVKAAPPGPATVTAPPSAPAAGKRLPESPAAALPAHSRKESWLILSGIAVLVAIGLFVLWRMQRPAAATRGEGPAGSSPLLEVLKEEIFQLESDRLRGSISAEEYAATKEALQQSMRRAMARKG